ncbi:MAG TPA: GntR family transcriptional regulator [Bacillota bacterium]|nr:GntR family transcriptional regulator [Bacillota bacterium]
MEEFLTLKDHVYNYIADQILDGSLVPGKKINENSISEKLNISRTPVREALIQLASEGFLENVPRKGFVIKHLNVEEAKETYLIIGILDGTAVALACPLITEQAVKDMEFYATSMDLAIETANFTMYHKLQEEFHNVYLALCPNRSLVNILLQLKKKFLRRSYVAEPESNMKEILFATNGEHREMIRMIKEKDTAGLERYMRETHWNTQKAYMETL